MPKIKIYDKITETLVREVFFTFRNKLGYGVLSSREEFPDFILLKGDKIVHATVVWETD